MEEEAEMRWGGKMDFFHDGLEVLGFHGGGGTGPLVFGVVARFGREEVLEDFTVREHADAGVENLRRSWVRRGQGSRVAGVERSTFMVMRGRGEPVRVEVGWMKLVQS